MPDTTCSTAGRILVVDDDALLRTTVSMLLNLSGFDTVEAVNGEEAVEVFAKADGSLNAVLLDLNMPVMDGHTALEQIRKTDPSIPIFIVSSLTDALSDRERELVNGVIQKPFSAEDFISQVKGSLAGSLATQ